MATQDLKVGDKVRWNSTQGKVSGCVKKKLTAPIDIKTHHAAASLDKTQAEFTAGDIADARKVIGYSHRHLAQGPAGDVGSSPWRLSLMNWGHDPKESKS